MILATLFLLALTRAEIVQRVRAPVMTQADGLVKVFANCAEDLRREYQGPVARFAAETVRRLYRGLGRRPARFAAPGIVIHVGDVRTNVSEVAVRVTTNGARVVSRIYLKSPAYADLDRFRLELVRAFGRAVLTNELTEAEGLRIYRAADPRLRAADDRARLERWLAGASGEDDEEMLRLMRKVLEPGRASRRDVITFASRLFLYPALLDERFAGGADCLSFREAVAVARVDSRVRLVARAKADEMPVWGGGRGAAMSEAAAAYRLFLLELARGELDDGKLCSLLEAADVRLLQVLAEVTKGEARR